MSVLTIVSWTATLLITFYGTCSSSVSGAICQNACNPHEPPAPTEILLVLGMCCKRQSWLASDHKVLLRLIDVSTFHTPTTSCYGAGCNVASWLQQVLQEHSGEEWTFSLILLDTGLGPYCNPFPSIYVQVANMVLGTRMKHFWENTKHQIDMKGDRLANKCCKTLVCQ